MNDNIKKIQKLVSEFADFVIKQQECIDNGDWKLGNTYAKKYIKCYKDINKIGNVAKEEMLTLLKHKNDVVRTMAATFLLKYSTEESLRVLKEISKKPGMVGFGARESIKRWEEGSWDLDS